VEVWYTSNLWSLRLGEEYKKEEDRQKPQGKNIISAYATQGGHKERRKKPQNKNIMSTSAMQGGHKKLQNTL